MRISTSQIFEQQTVAIDNQLATQTGFAQELSTGKKLNNPSDDPTQISLDLQTHAQIGVTNTSDTNVANSINELTTVDSDLAAVTSIVQSARSLTEKAATDTLDPTQRGAIANQVDALIQQAVGVANSTYGGKYLFSGTNIAGTPPVTTSGSPVSAVKFSGNFQTQSQIQADGEILPLASTLQKAFNMNAADGSLDVFQMLINLRNAITQTGNTTLAGSGQTVNGTVLDQTATAINTAGKTVDPTSTLAADAAANAFQTPLRTDSAGNVTFAITGFKGTANFTLNPATTAIEGALGPTANLVALINAQTANTGVAATFDTKTQKLTLSSGQPFQLADGDSGPAGNQPSNLTAVFGLTTSADLVNNLSRQLVDVDKVLSVVLSSRASVGTNIQTLEGLKTRFNTSITNMTAVQSNVEDASIPDTYSKYAQAQTALQAAYATTTRLESKSLFDYI